MTKEEIIRVVSNLLSNSMSDMEIENPKIDFKRSWYNLKTAGGIQEFLKDSTAIVNTIGPDGFIVIGYDEKTKTYRKSVFNKSKLRDTSDINGLITKHVSYPFEVNIYDEDIKGNKLSIIHIPPSIEKPHVIKLYKKIKGRKIKEYQNRIFIRKGTITTVANRYDLELMHYDKKNLNKPYQTHVYLRGFRDVNLTGVRISSKAFLTIENLGFRPLAICKMKIRLIMSDNTELNFTGATLKNLNGASKNSSLSVNPLVIGANSILNFAVEFRSVLGANKAKMQKFNSYKEKLKEITGEIILTTNSKVYFQAIHSKSLND